MKLNGFSRSLFSLSLVTTLSLSSFAVNAESACKGLEEAACKQSTSCNWISGYTTKNGNAVSAYCRSAGNKQKQGQNSGQEKGSQAGANDRADSGAIQNTPILEERNG